MSGAEYFRKAQYKRNTELKKMCEGFTEALQ